MNRAIFLDRDGTVCEEVGYLNHIDRLRLLPRVPQAVRAINDASWTAILVTNQSGIARGRFDVALLERVHERLVERLAAGGARLDGIYYCPHHPTEGRPPYRMECDCRKPGPGLLERAAREHDLDLTRSYMIGDTIADIATARNAGLTPVLVRTGYGAGEIEYRLGSSTAQPDHVAQDLHDAVTWILARERGDS